MTEQNIAWFHCYSGVAGNMALGALIDAGANVDEITEMVSQVDIAPFVIEATPVLRGGISATHVDVKVDDDSRSRDYKTIVSLINNASLPDRVKQRSLDTFKKLGEVEASLHGTELDNLHFHEVGSMDAIVDIVGTACALEIFNVDKVFCSVIANGVGTINSEHGELPNPPPAVMKLLEGIPTNGRDIDAEITTPTGAALMATLADTFGAMPPMTITTSGFGAGTKEFRNTSNTTHAVIGTQIDGESDNSDLVIVIETTVDDVSGELLSYTIQKCLEAGAFDAWASPILMKKGRPGFVFSAICAPARLGAIRKIISDETGTFGVRATEWSRWPVAREFTSVQVMGHEISIKVSDHRAKVEFEDAVRAAAALDLPVREVIRQAEQIYWSRQNN
jgi:uncharacterized protein (TIGR00299 family) protein